MNFCGIELPDNPLTDIIGSWKNRLGQNDDFDIQQLWEQLPIDCEDVAIARSRRAEFKQWGRKHLLTGCFVYPPGGGMGWHTNSNNAGIRIYLSWSETGDSGMGWLNEDGTVRLDYDSPGWNIRVFNVPEWHCVFSNCWRCSIGMKP